jgi:beta-amylase
VYHSHPAFVNLGRYDDYAFDRIAESAFGRSAVAANFQQVTFLRMGDLMFDHWPAFCAFLKRMKSEEEAAN